MTGPGSATPGRDADAAVRGVLDLSPHPVVGVDDAGRVVLVNALAEQLTGWTHDELVGRPVEELLPQELRGRHERLRTAYHHSPVRREVGELEALRLRRRDGSEVPVDVALTPLTLATGSTWVLAALSDVTQRLATESRVLDLTRSYRMLAAINQAVLRAGSAVDVTAEACRVAVEEGGFLAAWVGRGPRSSMTLRVAAVAGPAARVVGEVGTAVRVDDPRLSGVTAAAVRARSTRSWGDVAHPFAPLPAAAAGEGVQDAVALLVPTDEEDDVVLTLYCHRPAVFTEELVVLLEQVAFNIALALDRYAADAAVRREVAHRRELSARLLTAQEDERRRLATEVHDEPVQLLAATELRLGLLRRRVAAHDPEGLPAVDLVHDGLRGTATALRRLLTELEPPRLDTAWDEAVESAAEQVLEDHPTTWRLVGGPPGWTPETGAQALRIVREALINVRRHAAAAQVVVATRRVEGGVEVSVTDDGVGLADGATRARPGHRGVQGMQDRAETLGGWCRVEPGPDGGTRVVALLPA
ncbi:sensor histidine kinase [Lapillicoccus jejuensis]|uniref:PAS domain S-box-containing protein n=1 Tax=Lapillicoccus jejuensis TaxID=402171 RepID=A0A542DXZ0_9MICO|nr:PAS domain S-box protein [Lapillicoccus jejuensis]TQJ07962.1 PAS domain S-box-containing protein [Lapillicoccus jejuensis]